MTKYKLEFIVFISGAVVMILEITGSRVLAPYLGTSLFVWTSIIGIILGSLSLGYYLGGKLADKEANYNIFSLIIFIAALLIGSTTVLKEALLQLLQVNISSIKLGAVLAATALFAPASIFLGMVSPYAVKLKMKDLKTSGRTVGNLYAISTIGSITGTFLAGFVLISYFGNTKLLLILTITLILCSILGYKKKLLKSRTLVLSFFIIYLGTIQLTQASFEESGYLDIDTNYSRVRVVDDGLIRKLRISERHSSAMYLYNDEPVYEYVKFYHLFSHFNPEFENVLMIGGGAYSFPKDFLKKYATATIDVVEIDPKITEIAQKYFRLEENDRLEIFHEDGRTYLNKNEEKYDAILIDAFLNYYSIPHHLTTIETVEKVYESLNKNGVVALNLVSSMEGETSQFLRAEYKTYKEVFPQVYLFPVQAPDSSETFQNIFLIALKSETLPSFENEDPIINERLEHLWEEEIDLDIPVLTDDFAPVDQYLMDYL